MWRQIAYANKFTYAMCKLIVFLWGNISNKIEQDSMLTVKYRI